MQLDQQPPSGNSDEPVIDLTSDTPTRSFTTAGTTGSNAASLARPFGLAAGC